MLTPESLPPLQLALREADIDGWLLYDFHGLNPIANGLLGLTGMGTRRVFVLIPREGEPVAITHAIEQGPWRDWPSAWAKVQYSGWRALESALRTMVSGKTVAMEYSPGDAVPYLDRVPAGVLEMVSAAGATVVSSAELVSRFTPSGAKQILRPTNGPRRSSQALRATHSAGRATTRATVHRSRSLRCSSGFWNGLPPMASVPITGRSSPSAPMRLTRIMSRPQKGRR